MNLVKPTLAVIVFLFLCDSLAFSQEKEQYVILISLDGFRYDYVERFQPENLLKFIEKGTAAEALIPSFPTKTFPNHYTIATGKRPENHGLVDNSFYDPAKGQTYRINNREIVGDGDWYGGTPLWVLAEQSGMKAASYFFVGTEAPVKGIRPSYYHLYDVNVPNLTRISVVLEWLQLPERERPNLITLYFSDMDDVGHRYGPSNDEQLSVRLQRLDKELGVLFDGLNSLDMDLNVIIVSDHGMADVPKEQLLDLNVITADIPARVVNNGALAHLYLENPSQTEQIVQQLNHTKGPYKAVKTNDTEYYQDLEKFGARIGDILIIPDFGHYLATPAGMMAYQNRTARFKTNVYGEHGFHPEHMEMHGIFYAKGPAIKEGMQVKPFQNIHVYPLICQILGLPIPDDIDGDLEVLKPILKEKLWKEKQ
ncbi:alkaline phosphatase family protein [Pararhodonellum marinum]|uniref:alkaline phosphatase family protein n=1 Tax=Pararhodonellum marinum TaxID=2755358 RepID=UPI00188FD468|nr:ectonucleotide pyrophosphatase/phosphodiesterase [Pararhodonellum marinum]